MGSIEKLVATETLRDRLVFLAGSASNYITWTLRQMPDKLDRAYLWRLLHGKRVVPVKHVVSLVRIAEEDKGLSKDEAWALRHNYFDLAEEVSDSE